MPLLRFTLIAHAFPIIPPKPTHTTLEQQHGETRILNTPLRALKSRRALTKALSIVASIPKSAALTTDKAIMTWLYFQTPYGKPAGDRNDPALIETRKNQDSDKQLYPPVAGPMDLFGESCNYMANGRYVRQLACSRRTGDGVAVNLYPCRSDPSYYGFPLRGFERLG